MIKFIKTLSVFLLLSMFIGNNTSFSQTSQPKQNCTYKNASVFFANPTLILSKYSSEYFCTDIIYLEKNNLGNISLSAYQKLYTTASSNFNYLRSLGITPDILNEYLNDDELEDEEKINFSDKLAVNNLIKTLIMTAQIGADFTITPAQSFSFDASEEDFENSDEFTGSIVNPKGKNCITDKRLNYSSTDGLYTPKTLTYFDVMSALPVAIRPVAIKGNKLVNMQGTTMATIEFNTSIGGNVISQGVGKSSIRKITFNNNYQRQTSVNINWNEKKCKTDTLEAKVAKSSVCFMCPYIIMLFDEISMLFDYMYKTFAKYIIIFMVLFGCFYFLTSFLKGFKNAPFEVNTNNFFSDIVEKLKLIFIVATVLLVPVGYLFSFTFEPIMDLTLGVADKVISVENTKSTCNPDTVFDEIRQRKISKQDDQIIPPVVKLKQIEMQKNTEINYVLSKQTIGSLVCFLTDTINTNGKQMVMGKVLMKNLFNFKSNTKILSFFVGIIIWGLFFIINFMISFYILDGLIDILKIAILWPFMVFGYAFNWIGFNIISSIVDTAKNFGFTMITLAVFSLFNRTLIYSFYFKNSNESVLGILDKAIAENNPDIILNAIPTDIISVSSFAFIIYAMYYVYSKLSEFASSYGGSVGSITLSNNMKNTFKSILGLKVQREQKESYSKKDNTSDKSKTKEEEVTSTTEETEITNE
ncbi:MAG: hypothetical protein ACI4N3_04555 [Alphaproteobacteria bacterium]